MDNALMNNNPNEEWDDTFEERPTGAVPASQEENQQQPSEVPQSEAPEDTLTVNGVSLDDLNIEETSTEEAPVEEAQPEKPIGYEEFANNFKKYLGIDLEQAKLMVAELQGFRVQTLVEKQQSQLKSKWGDDYDNRFNAVKEYYSKLPQDKQQALDNVEGAELIWAKIERDQQAQRQNRTPQVPNFVSGRTTSAQTRTSTGNKPVFQYSDIVNMSPSEYRARQQEIQSAFDEGRVNMDSDDSPF
jgi:hypothetical protein